MNSQAQLDVRGEAAEKLRMNAAPCGRDLFSPDFALPLPNEVLSIPQSNDALARIKPARSHFQRGLMNCLCQHDPNEISVALQSMQQAIEIVLACMPQDESRSFWWIAHGLLDCVKLGGLPDELNARKLFSRIDRQMHAVAEDNTVDARGVMNEMLYLVGRSSEVSDQVGQIKQHYALEKCFPNGHDKSATLNNETRNARSPLPSPPPAGEGDRVSLPEFHVNSAQPSQDEVVQLLGIMHVQFRLAEENWEDYAQGDAAAIIKFIEYVKNLVLQSEKLKHNSLQQLTRQILKITVQIDSPEYVRLIAMDMAMALLLLGNGIEHYSHLSDSFEKQADILFERMRSVLNQQPEDKNQLVKLVDLHCQMQQGAVMIPLAKAMLVNLQQVKQDLNAYIHDVSKRDELNRLQFQLTEIRGGLRFISLQEAEKLLVSIQDGVLFFEQAKATPKPVESSILTGAVSALEIFLNHLAGAQKNDVKGLLASLEELSELRQSAAMPVAAPVKQAGVAVVEERSLNEDQELLEVFLEEAQEALSVMRGSLETCQLHPDSHEALTIIRRCFHTLKGSGRMVGLTDLGEAAWEVERALNKWLRDNRSSTPQLLHVINQAIQKFSGWVDALKSHGCVLVDAADLIEMARKIEHGIDSEMAKLTIPAHQSGGGPEPVVSEQVAPELVSIGEISINSTLFKISSKEAKQNALSLRDHLVAMNATQPLVVQYDFMRAAHTLAGVCRNLGVTAVANLAHGLENWLQARMEHSFTLNNSQTQMLENTIVALHGMVQAICERKMPVPNDELVEQLFTDKDRLCEALVLPSVLGVSEILAQQSQPAEAKKPEAPVRVAKLQVRDDVDEQLLPIFLAEADELSPKIAAGLRAWHDTPHDTEQSDLLKRWLHTFKGSARMAGAMRIGEIAHKMEDRVLAGARMQNQAGYWDNLDIDFDRISVMLEEFRDGKVSLAAGEAPEFDRRAEDLAAIDFRAERRAQEAGTERAQLASMLRVRSDVVDRLVNEAGEISVARSRMEAEMSAFKEGLLELTNSVERLRSQLREVEIQAESQMQARVLLLKDDAEHFDPLEFDRFTRLQELTRFMNESVHDVQTVQQSLLKNIDETAAAMSAQARLNRELQQGLMNVRMVPFASISERLYRIVRQTGKELDKRANLELAGSGVELDRSVLEKMAAPFEHLLRNSMAHGLENELLRIQSSKDPIGEIRLNLRQESNEVVFEFSDDGAGLNLAALRNSAIGKGLLAPDQTVSNEQLAQFIFTSGISTATEVTEVAGRGIGMDVVRSEIAALGGRIDVTTQHGKGTQFIIHLPLTLAVTQTLMVRSGDTIYAIPSVMIEQVRQVKSAEMAAMYSERQTLWQGKTYPLHYLPHLLGDMSHVAENTPRNSLLLLRSGEQRIVLHVDELLGNQETVVKNIGPQLARLPGIAGATVLGNGTVVLILNPTQLAQHAVVAMPSPGTVAMEKLRTQPLVMVVDDSLTVRKITSRLLTRAGYQVATAKDGMDALEQLGEISPDVMLLDIEMPRMDGFELLKHLRQDRRTLHLPVIIITSRTAEKHRNYARELEVSAYLGKPYQEEVLLQHISELVAMSHGDKQ
jgi:chemosensory pili system protein ChpA (sensor histidine kinase/response regulator)